MSLSHRCLVLVVLGYFCNRASRIAALGTLALAMLELSSKLADQPGRGLFLVAILLLFAISGVRGAFAVAKFRAQQDASDKTSEPPQGQH